MQLKIRPIAIYLPQFHPIPENDEWWGKGFTEWTNVTKAKPLFKDHYQPHLPADLGFYDLRLEETRMAQEALAKQYGIYGFCYYHYWFNGKRMLHEPLDRKLQNENEDLPFMLCWANENWTRTWDGLEKNVLLQQNYSKEDDIDHINYLIKFFKDKRYIRVDNKPVLAIYKTHLVSNIKETITLWRQEASKHGLELYICRFENFEYYGAEYIKDAGFDAAIEFMPHGRKMMDYRSLLHKRFIKNIFKRVINKIVCKYLSFFDKDNLATYTSLRDGVIDYEDFVEYAKKYPPVQYKLYPGITPSWDNSARKKKSFFIFKKASPKAYGNWLKHILKNFEPFSPEENFIFINAWNEWAEGNHLEPCSKWKRSYLEETKQALENE